MINRLENPRRVLCFVIIVLTLSLLIGCKSNPWEQAEGDLLLDIERYFDGRLPPLSESLPSYSRPSHELPSLVIGFFEQTPGTPANWHLGLADLTRRMFLSIPQPQIRLVSNEIFEASSFVRSRADGTPPSGLEALSLIAKALNISHLLRASLSVDDQKFSIKLDLREVSTQRVISDHVYAGDLTALPAQLEQIVVDIHNHLNVPLYPGSLLYLSRMRPRSVASLKNYLETTGMLWLPNPSTSDFRSAIDNLWVNEPSALIGQLRINRIKRIVADEYQQLIQVRLMEEKFPESYGVRMSGAIGTPFESGRVDGDFAEKYKKLCSLISDHPGQADALSELSYLYSSTMRSLHAVNLCLEGLKRWPEYYKFWYLLSWIVAKDAYKIRGYEYSGSLSRDVLARFAWGLRLADRAVSEAIRLREDDARVWEVKMYVAAGHGPDLKEAFYKGIGYQPKLKVLYSTALNFSLPQWGGNRAVRMKIMQLAENNIDDKEWLNQMRKTYLEDPKAWSTGGLAAVDSMPDTLGW